MLHEVTALHGGVDAVSQDQALVLPYHGLFVPIEFPVRVPATRDRPTEVDAQVQVYRPHVVEAEHEAVVQVLSQVLAPELEVLWIIDSPRGRQ